MNIYMVTVLLLLIVKDTPGQNESTISNGSWILYTKPYNIDLFSTPKIYKRPLIELTVNLHNMFRARVKPSASNMLEMKWHEEAADRARNWSEQCIFTRQDDESNRYVTNLGNCGQNVMISSYRIGWWEVIDRWFRESKNFTYGSNDNIFDYIGHYTQMVWATSHYVGCHVARCPYGYPWSGVRLYNYVCNYCPTGNWLEKLGTPYKTGKYCDLCPGSCTYKKLCTNFCPYIDLYKNCRNYSREWICDGEDAPGRRRFNYCKATCICQNYIHEWL